MAVSGNQPLSTKGPVPTSSDWSSTPTPPPRRMDAWGVARRLANTGLGSSSRNSTLSAPTARTPPSAATPFRTQRPGRALAGLSMRSKLITTSCAVRLEPSWNWTSGLKPKAYVKPSSDTDHRSAKAGTTPRSPSNSNSPSYI